MSTNVWSHWWPELKWQKKCIPPRILLHVTQSPMWLKTGDGALCITGDALCIFSDAPVMYSATLHQRLCTVQHCINDDAQWITCDAQCAVTCLQSFGRFCHTQSNPLRETFFSPFQPWWSTVHRQRQVFKDFFRWHSDLRRHENRFQCRLQP